MGNKYFLALIILLLALLLAACTSTNFGESDPIKGLDSPIQVGEISLTVLDASIRNSMQTHYLMTYPKEGHVFFRLTLKIENVSPDPDETLEWGLPNLELIAGDANYTVAEAQRIIEDDQVNYKVGEDVSFMNVYFFEVPANGNFQKFELQVPDSQRIPVGQIVEVPDKISEDEIDLHAVEAGGSQNSASAYHATIGGGQLNVASASHATVAGGRENSATYFYATIGGGYANTTSARDTVISGGSRNSVSAPYGTVGGGIQNNAEAPNTTIAGGAYNIASDDFATIAGGTRNLASGFNSVIAGGAGNLSSADQATVSGGLGNQASGSYTTIGGGHGNLASGTYATIPGGFLNQANADLSFAAGNQAVINENHSGVFIFADSQDFAFHSERENEFAVRATGGVRLITGIDVQGSPTIGALLPAGSGSWATLSDQNFKESISPVDPDQILGAIIELPISSWRYKGQDASIVHIGPMAQDFYQAFGLGEDKSHISTVDADGVALASIQALYNLSVEQDAIIQSQSDQIESMEKRLQALEMAESSNPWMLFLVMIYLIASCGFMVINRPATI